LNVFEDEPWYQLEIRFSHSSHSKAPPDVTEYWQTAGGSCLFLPPSPPTYSASAAIIYSSLATTQLALAIRYRVPLPEGWCIAIVLLDVAPVEGISPLSLQDGSVPRRSEYIPGLLDRAVQFCSSVFAAKTTSPLRRAILPQESQPQCRRSRFCSQI
jgi:hypothetical protein